VSSHEQRTKSTTGVPRRQIVIASPFSAALISSGSLFVASATLTRMTKIGPKALDFRLVFAYYDFNAQPPAALDLDSAFALTNLANIISPGRQQGNQVQVCALWVHNDGGRANWTRACLDPDIVWFGIVVLQSWCGTKRNRAVPEFSQHQPVNVQ